MWKINSARINNCQMRTAYETGRTSKPQASVRSVNNHKNTTALFETMCKNEHKTVNR